MADDVFLVPIRGQALQQERLLAFGEGHLVLRLPERGGRRRRAAAAVAGESVPGAR